MTNHEIENVGAVLVRELMHVVRNMKEDTSDDEDVVVRYFLPAGGILNVAQVVSLEAGLLGIEGCDENQQRCVVFAPAFSVQMIVTKTKAEKRVVGFNTGSILLGGDRNTPI